MSHDREALPNPTSLGDCRAVRAVGGDRGSARPVVVSVMAGPAHGGDVRQIVGLGTNRLGYWNAALAYAGICGAAPIYAVLSLSLAVVTLPCSARVVRPPCPHPRLERAAFALTAWIGLVVWSRRVANGWRTVGAGNDPARRAVLVVPGVHAALL